MARSTSGSTLIEAMMVSLLLAAALPPVFMMLVAAGSKMWLEHRLYQALTRSLTEEPASRIIEHMRNRITRELPWGKVRHFDLNTSKGSQKWKTAKGDLTWCFELGRCFEIRMAGTLKEQSFLRQ